MLLITSTVKKEAECIADTFRYMSILAFPTTPKDALSEVSEKYSALIILYPTDFPDIKDYLSKVKSYCKALPVFAIIKDEISLDLRDFFDGIFSSDRSLSYIAKAIMKYSEDNNIAKIGSYKLAGIDASANKYGVTYFSSPLHLTKTEAMILRYLIRSYPIPQDTGKIIKYVFKSTRAPEASGIRTHISSINKKLSKKSEKKLIEHAQNKGYYVLTPELLYYNKMV